MNKTMTTEKCEEISFLMEEKEFNAFKKILTSHKDAVTCRDRMGRTLLMYAVMKKDVDFVQWLIDQGSDVNAKDKKNWQAIHFTAQHKNLPMVKLLLENGADINAQHRDGGTVLHKFVLDEDAKEYLISKGADINLKNFHDISPQDIINMMKG